MAKYGIFYTDFILIFVAASEFRVIFRNGTAFSVEYTEVDLCPS